MPPAIKGVANPHQAQTELLQSLLSGAGAGLCARLNRGRVGREVRRAGAGRNPQWLHDQLV